MKPIYKKVKIDKDKDLLEQITEKSKEIAEQSQHHKMKVPQEMIKKFIDQEIITFDDENIYFHTLFKSGDMNTAELTQFNLRVVKVKGLFRKLNNPKDDAEANMFNNVLVGFYKAGITRDTSLEDFYKLLLMMNPSEIILFNQLLEYLHAEYAIYFASPDDYAKKKARKQNKSGTKTKKTSKSKSSQKRKASKSKKTTKKRSKSKSKNKLKTTKRKTRSDKGVKRASNKANTSSTTSKKQSSNTNHQPSKKRALHSGYSNLRKKRKTAIEYEQNQSRIPKKPKPKKKKQIQQQNKDE